MTLAAIAVAIGLLVRHGFQTLDAEPWVAERSAVPPSATWEEILSKPGSVTVEPLVTGVVRGDRFVVLDERDPSIEHMGERDAPSVVLAYLVRHESAGDYLVDAGLAAAFARDGGNYTVALSILLALIGAEASQAEHADVASRLRARGIEPRAVFLTHLHADHTSGLVDLDPSIPAVFGRGESTFVQRALMGDHLRGRPSRTLDLAAAPARRPFEHALDLLGDGSLWAIATPGHSPGHVSYLVNGARPVLITGDAAAYRAQLEHRIRPSPRVHDPAAAARSLDGLAELVRRADDRLDVALGHEDSMRSSSAPPRR